MKPLRNLRGSLLSLFAHRLRAALALLGISVGVASVLVLVGIGEGARREVVRGIEAFGTDLLVVKASKTQFRRTRTKTRQGGSFRTLTRSDAQAIEDECPSVAVAVPVHDQPAQIKFEQLATGATVVGTTPAYLDVRRFTLARGRFFTAAENRASQRVVVLGSAVQTSLFGQDDALGEIVRVGRVPFEVIGVLEEKGVSPDGADEDAQIVIPLRTALRRVFQKDYVELVYAQARSSGHMAQAEAEVTQVLRERHRLDLRGRQNDFEIQNLAHVLSTEQKAANAFTTLVGGVAGLSLLVGGFGILSIMLLTARERRGEIGLRMAVGARRRDILVQFLVESLALGLLGGLLGVGAGLATAAAVGRWTHWTTAVPPELVGASVFFSMAVGLLFGVYPARRASRLDPIESMRRA